MKFRIERITDPINFSAGNPVTLDLGDRSDWIMGLVLSLEVAKVDAALPVPYQDFLYRSMTGLSLMGSNTPYVAINGPDLRSLYWATRLRNRSRFQTPDWVAGAVTMRHDMALIFGVNPIQVNDGENLFDLTAGIKPAPDVSLTINWAAATALGANMTIGAATRMRVAVLGMIPETEAEEPKWMPRWRSNRWAPPMTYAGLEGLVQLDPGFHYRRSTIMVVNGASPADNRTDGLAGAAISEIGVATADGRHPMALRMEDFSKLSQAQFSVADDNAAVPGGALAPGASVITARHNPGVGMIDWAQLADTSKLDEANPLYGLNMVRKKAGTASLAFTVDTNVATQVVQLHECYAPYSG